MATPVKAVHVREPFSLKKVMRFSTASKPQTSPMINHVGDPDDIPTSNTLQLK